MSMAMVKHSAFFPKSFGVTALDIANARIMNKGSNKREGLVNAANPKDIPDKK